MTFLDREILKATINGDHERAEALRAQRDRALATGQRAAAWYLARKAR